MIGICFPRSQCCYFLTDFCLLIAPTTWRPAVSQLKSCSTSSFSTASRMCLHFQRMFLLTHCLRSISELHLQYGYYYWYSFYGDTGFLDRQVLHWCSNSVRLIFNLYTILFAYMFLIAPLFNFSPLHKLADSSTLHMPIQTTFPLLMVNLQIQRFTVQRPIPPPSLYPLVWFPSQTSTSVVHCRIVRTKVTGTSRLFMSASTMKGTLLSSPEHLVKMN